MTDLSKLANNKIINLLDNKISSSPPIWLMRQAGRYLPEYLTLRAKNGNFLNCCYNPEVAAEITLQPIRRFNFDAAIIFSDILVIPDALGIDVEFFENIGPVLNTIKKEAEIDKLRFNQSTLEPIYKAIKIVKKNLPNHITLIGFAGAPWTLAAYMLEGRGSKNFELAKKWAYQNPKSFAKLLTVLEDAIFKHLALQIEAGSQMVQIFDSWAGLLNEDEIKNWSITPIKNIVNKLKKKYPQVIVSIFPKGVKNFYQDYEQEIKADIISLDYEADLRSIASSSKLILQGNLDPEILAQDKNKALEKTKEILDIMRGKKFIFNLGHGILPTTPLDNVYALIECVRSYG